MDFFMENKMLKGIYLHGYQGYVTQEKKAFLERFGDIYAPNIDYDNNPAILHKLYDNFKDEKIDFVAGTSLGGILIYHLAILLDVPCLLLNPAVIALEQVRPFIPKEAFTIVPAKDIFVLVGMKDEVVNPKLQLDFFDKINQESNNVTIKIDENLEHFIPYNDFEVIFQEFKKYI